MPSGPMYWTQPFGPPCTMFVADMPVTFIEAMAAEPIEPHSPIQPMLYGGHVFQTTPALTGAPIDLRAQNFQVTMSDRAEEEYHALKRAEDLSRIAPVNCWLPKPISDRWLIPAMAKTSWVLSRSFPFSLVPFNGGNSVTVPRVFIEASPGGTETKVELTRNATSPPDAGEFYVNTGTDGSTIETLDLSGPYAGRILALRYYPKRLMRVGPIPEDVPEPNGMDYEITLEEVLPPRTYA